MNYICRLCFTVATQAGKEIAEGSDILLKIQSYLVSVQIVFNEHLPNHICTDCLNKLEEIEAFIKIITDNQKKLYELLKNGREKLERFYLSLNTKPSVKDEFNDNRTLILDNKENETNNASVYKDICDTIDNNDHRMPIKAEQIFNVPFQCSSDDEVTLSSLKREKEYKGTGRIKKKKNTKCAVEKVTKPSEETNEINDGINNAHQNTILKDQDHKCLTCSDSFRSQNDLLKHYNKEHSSKKDKHVMKSYSVSDKNGIQSYDCNKCHKIYDNLRAVKRHLEAHVKDRPFICKVCGRTYRTVSEIIRHGRAHNGVKLHCSYECGYSTVYMGALKEHEKRHRTEFKYKCEKCDKGFQVRTWYEEHQNVHNGVKPFVCNICGLAFHMSRYLTAHRSTVHPQSSDLKRYICMHCSLPCDSRKALTVHLKEHGIVRCFLCDICGKTLSSKEQLKFHKQVHLGEKPFGCSICNKSFTKKCNLKLHELTHTDERSHVCTKCGKKYKQRSTLVKHNLKYCRGP